VFFIEHPVFESKYIYYYYIKMGQADCKLLVTVFMFLLV